MRLFTHIFMHCLFRSSWLVHGVIRKTPAVLLKSSPEEIVIYTTPCSFHSTTSKAVNWLNTSESFSKDPTTHAIADNWYTVLIASNQLQ